MNTTLLVPWIADPSNGTWVSGNAEIAAIEYDFSSIAGASFEYSKNALDWRLIGVDNNGTDGTYNAQWNTSLVAEGWYYLRVTMHDASGHFGQSAIQVYVDPTPPVPTITQPSDNSEIASCPTQLEATTQARDIAGVVFAYHNASNPDFIKDSLPILKQPDEYSCRPTAEAASFLWLAQKSTGDPNLVTQEMKDDTSILIYDLRTKMGTKGTIESGPENKTGTTNEKAQVGIYKYLEEYYARMTKANEVDPKKNPAPVVFKEHTDMTEDWPNFNWFSIYRNHLPSDDVILSLRIEEWDWVNNKPILDPKTGKPKATYHSVAGMGYDILKWVGGPQHGKPRTDQGGVYFMDPSVGQTYGTMLKNGEIMNYQDSKGHYLLQGKRIFLNAISTLTPRKDLSTKQLKKIEDPYGWTVIGVDTDGLNGWTTTWDTSALPLGPYLLLAVMVDSAGNAASDIIWVELRGAWPMFHNYLTHTGYSTSTAPNTNQTVWNYATGSYVTSSPAVVDGVVFVGSGDNNVYALNAMTGTQVWNYTTSSPVNWASPAVAGGVVYVGSNDGKVYALNATTGTKMWDYTTSGAVYSSPAVVGGVVYEGSTDGKVYALNATTGTQVWSYTTDSEVWSSPAVAGGVVYVGSNDGKVYALNATTGTKMWDYTTSGAVYSSPAVDGGVVFVGSCNNNTYALNASTGAFIWSYKTNSYVYSSPAVAAGKVYVGSGNIFEGLGNGKIYCLNASSGAFIWNYTTGGWVSSSAAVAGGVVYVGSFDGKVYALDATTGAQVWSYRTGGWVFSSPAVVNWIVYVGSLDGKIYALGGVHDVAVTNVASSKTVVGQGYSASINVIVSNQGSYTETFNVTARADGVGVNDGLVGYWSFDEGRGTTAHDTSGNLNDGTIYGANWTDGKFGKALSFDGIDDYVAVPGSPSLNNISDAVTIAAWVKLEQVPTEAYELISAGGYSYVAYAYVADPAGVRFNFGRVTAPGVGDDLQQEFWKQYGATLPYLPYNQWYHVVWMYDSSGYAAIYVNGKPYANTTLMSGKIYSFGGSLTIDARNLHKGILDEVRIYNRTLSQQEIRAVAGSGAIQTQTVSLTSGDSTTITFTWNTTGFAKGNYTLWSYAEPVQGETFTFDNSFTDGWVLISIHCDINSDGIVDISDILDTALAFGSTPGHPLWNPNCDLDNNGIVDISDILEVALHYGETDP
jgi:outer membrane protein assembly factor BamB